MTSDSDENFGRFRALEPGMLLETQVPAVRQILKGFAKLVSGNAEEIKSGLSEKSDMPDGHASTKRPHQVFLIDGARGSGKTYTLLSAEHALNQLDLFARESSAVSGAWRDKLQKEWVGGALLNDDKVKSIVSISRSLCHTLHIIFPGDMEDGDAVMEALFAAMTTKTAEVADKLKDKHEDSHRKRVEEAKDLNKRLTEQVAQGWYFARRFGYDALVRDSTDYNDLVGRFEEESRKGANRIDAWRGYVERYLRFHGAAMLVVLLDDTDVKPELTENILHAIRMYLDHPRVITVLAGNLKSMRNSLLHLEMKRLGPAVQALNNASHITARDWRRHERQSIEDYLEKVLPPAQRIWLGRPRLVPLRERDGESGELQTGFSAIVGQSLNEVCADIMRYTREDFMKVKFKLAIARELGRSDAPQPHEKGKLEYYLSWWMFANRYREQLQPRSVRQLLTWRDYYFEITAQARAGDKRASPKRLPVMLFDNPANYALIQRLTDVDERLIEWLRRQDLSSIWVDRRIFRVNDRDIDEGSYTYDYVQYRHDVGLATPVRNNADDIMSSTLMPALVGRRFMRRFFQPRQMPRRHRRIGLAQWLDHAAVPASCCYMFDIAKLPDASFVRGSPDDEKRAEWIECAQNGNWEAGLCENWMELIEDRQERQEGEYLLRYLREIVFEALRETKGITSESLMMELDPTDAYEKHRLAVYEHFLRDEITSFAMAEIDRRILFRDKAEGMRPDGLSKRKESMSAPPIGDVQRPERMLALYSALITDLRRAWHAIRIYQAAPNLAEDRQGRNQFPYEYSSFAAIANRDRMPILTIKKLKEEILQATAWSRRMLEIFDRKSVKTYLGNRGEDIAKRLFDPVAADDADIHKSYVPQGLEETGDFKGWTETLRKVGRAACNGWPIWEKEHLMLEDAFFDEKTKRFKLDIFATQQGDAKADSDQYDNRRNGRSARNFTWLLWGLAPSLPAVIHAEVMSVAYKAELDRTAADNYEEFEKDSEKRNSSVNRLREGARKSYERALELTTEWAALVGSLSVTLRYIKIKCLHLDAALLFENMLAPDATGEDVVRLFRRNGLERPGGDSPEAAREANEAAMRAMAKIRDMFGTFNEDGRSEKKLARHLAISPDISPTSLFGDDWINDLLNKKNIQTVLNAEGFKSRPKVDRDEPSDASDNPLETSGIFVEAEQWLWATNRSLRKLHHEIKDRYEWLNRSPKAQQPRRKGGGKTRKPKP